MASPPQTRIEGSGPDAGTSDLLRRTAELAIAYRESLPERRVTPAAGEPGPRGPRRGGISAIVLAAGSASRFGSPKALALLDGRPLLQHVLDAVAAVGFDDVIVVLGAAAGQIEAAVAWRGERRIRNPEPERGLASSLKVGLEGLASEAEAALVVLGDQPRLRPDVVAAVIDRWRRGSNPIVVPRYQHSGTLNPVLLARAAWPLALALEGDRGMGPVIHGSPELVTDVPVRGDNPDVDTPADLALLAKTGRPDPAPEDLL